MIEIVEAHTPEHLSPIRALFLEYAASLDFSLEYQGFEAELAALPGRYAPPTGCLLLAIHGGTPAGCVAMREIEPAPSGRICEMKRLYVRPAARGLGLGRRLAERVIAQGKQLGYVAMRLDTSADMLAATTLYQSLGFRPIGRYNDDPLPCTVFMELRYHQG